MADGLSQKPPGLGAGAAVRKAPDRSILAPPDRRFNLKERFCCRFAAGAARADSRRNCLLQLAAAQGAGSVYIPRAGRFVIRGVARVPYRESWSMRRRSRA